MRESIFALILILATAGSLRAQYEYKFIFDHDFSASAGASDFVTIHKVLFSVEDEYLKPQLFDESSFGSKTGGIAYRLAKTIFIDEPVDFFIGTAQHEYFGHGWRLRELGAKNISYNIEPFPPYGIGGGFTSGAIYRSRDEDAVVDIAGSQANTIITEELRSVFLETGKMHYRQAFAYMFGNNDLTQYILSTNENNYKVGNDIIHYLSSVRQRNPAITLSTLKTYTLLNFANPFFFYSLYSYFCNYLVQGESTISYPMFNIFGLHYLPSLRFGLTPFGAESKLENLFKDSSRIYNIYFAYDGIGSNTSTRLGIHIDHVLRNSWLDIGIKAEYWYQPYFEFNSQFYASGAGGMIVLNSKIHFPAAESKTSLYLEGGFKSAGFTETERLSNGSILRAGLAFRE